MTDTLNKDTDTNTAANTTTNADETANVDTDEITKFDALAARWWDPDGDFKPLHDINPVRLAYIAERTELQNAKVLDVGCGGGILTEALAQAGAQAQGLDMAGKALNVAKLHALESGVSVTYTEGTAEAFAQDQHEAFDCVTCLEMLEHVTNYASTIQACADLVKPGGDVYFSTINRTLKAYGLLVLGAEYVLNILPRGTHEYSKFIRPSELATAIRKAGLDVQDISGMTYNPFSRRGNIGRDMDANYIVHARKPLA